MPLQHYAGDALLLIGLIVKIRIAKTSFTPDSGKFLSAKVPAIRYVGIVITRYCQNIQAILFSVA